jgi:Pao retrotransposon peptidase.
MFVSRLELPGRCSPCQSELVWIPCSNIVTKHVILTMAQQVFDSVGFSHPTTLYAKLLLQSTWKRNNDWDCELVEDLKERVLF